MPASKHSGNGQTSKPDAILLSLFANRFMSTAEAMGTQLERTSISTNIKLRKDFSCAIFADNGDLIANAPHLPVHLGSMSFAVRAQKEYWGDDIHDGDVFLTNHPLFGGSHLPDMTIITPVFQKGEIVFFTASRGHHSDVGGILPGSMPPNSQTIFEEGAQIKTFKIVSKGDYDRDGLLKLICDEPAKYPGCTGTRCLRDVESDLQAQIAANHKGVQLINAMIEEYGLDTVKEYMYHIRDNAELAVRNLLKEVASKRGNKLHAIDYLDDGSPIELHVDINEEEGSAVFDFEGTGPEIIGNLNAPTSVSYSAIIYSLRCMVDLDIPLNHGCLVPIEVKLPKGSLLNPSETAAVVGGNVCTSQRITDIVLKAFNAAAASQGDCNNLTFGIGETGEEGWGYYETIAGGSGAGPDWEGTDGVHTHMTNTRITDPEIFERRYPVILRQFSLREGSGGKGKNRGGEGVIRDIEFTEPLQCSILSERRVFRPFGMDGGGDALPGKNLWYKLPREEDGDLAKGQRDTEMAEREYRVINLGGKCTVKMGKGDRIVIQTPGGGAWGSPQKDSKPRERARATHHRGQERGSLRDRKSLAQGV